MGIPFTGEIDALRDHSAKYLKTWGAEFWILNTPNYCAKILDITHGFECSLHKHLKKTETFVILSGVVKLTVYPEDAPPNGGTRSLPWVGFMIAGDKRTINVGEYHQFSSEDGASVLEISTNHQESDSHRLTQSGPIR